LGVGKLGLAKMPDGDVLGPLDKQSRIEQQKKDRSQRLANRAVRKPTVLGKRVRGPEESIGSTTAKEQFNANAENGKSASPDDPSAFFRMPGEETSGRPSKRRRKVTMPAAAGHTEVARAADPAEPSPDAAAQAVPELDTPMIGSSFNEEPFVALPVVAEQVEITSAVALPDEAEPPQKASDRIMPEFDASTNVFSFNEGLSATRASDRGNPRTASNSKTQVGQRPKKPVLPNELIVASAQSDKEQLPPTISGEEFTSQLKNTLKKPDITQVFNQRILDTSALDDALARNARAQKQIELIAAFSLPQRNNELLASVDNDRTDLAPEIILTHEPSVPQLPHMNISMPQNEPFPDEITPARNLSAPQLSEKDNNMPQNEQSPNPVGVSAQQDMSALMAQMVQQLSGLNLKMDEQARLNDRLQQANQELAMKVEYLASANQRAQDDARFGADSAGRSPLSQDKTALPPMPSQERNDMQAYDGASASQPMDWDAAGPRSSYQPQALRDTALPEPLPYGPSTATAPLYQQTNSAKTLPGNDGNVVDIRDVVAPNRRVIADYDIELTTLSMSVERPKVEAMGAQVIRAGFGRDQYNNVIGTNKFVMPRGSSINEVWDYLADGHKCDAIHRDMTDPQNQQILLINHEWSQGVDTKGQTFTYKPHAGPALDLNSTTYGKLPDYMKKQIVFTSAGRDQSGRTRLGTYHGKAGQAIEPLAHLLSKDDRRDLDNAGLNSVYEQADAIAKTEQKDLAGRAQNNPVLKKFGNEQIGRNFQQNYYNSQYARTMTNPMNAGQYQSIPVATQFNAYTPYVAQSQYPSYSTNASGPYATNVPVHPYGPPLPGMQPWQAQSYQQPDPRAWPTPAYRQNGMDAPSYGPPVPTHDPYGQPNIKQQLHDERNRQQPSRGRF
jgi:hypothetical protein